MTKLMGCGEKGTGRFIFDGYVLLVEAFVEEINAVLVNFFSSLVEGKENIQICLL